MFKTIILLLNFLGLFFYQSILEEDISADLEFPKYVQAGDTFKVSITINKSDYVGFAKWQQELPKGFIASKAESGDATFSFKNNTLKFIWLSMPEEEQFSVSYLIYVDPELSGVFDMHGKYSFIVDNERKDVFSKKEKIGIVGKDGIYLDLPEEEIVEELPAEKTDNDEEILTFNEDKEESLDEVVETLPLEDNNNLVDESSEEEDLIKSITNLPSPERNVNYKVQIAAAHSLVDKEYFKRKHQLYENVAIESHQGWNKYTVGQFEVYQLARDKRNEVWSKIDGAFVTAYNHGERISVQEALMISQQKWFK